MTEHLDRVRNHSIERAKHRGRGFRAACWVLLLGGLALLAAVELLINVSQWYGWDLARFEFLHQWGCKVAPVTCNGLRLPPFFVPALIATLLGTGLVLLARHLLGVPPLLRDLREGEIGGPSHAQRSQRFGLVLAGVGLVTELIGFGIAVTGRPVSPWLWAGGLVAMVAGLAFEEHQAERPPLLRWQHLIYLAGVLLLLVAAVAVGGGRWPLALLAGALAMGMLGWFARRSRHSLDRNGRIERLLLPLIALLAVALAAYGLASWRWSFVGDEYSFFSMARDILDGKSSLHILAGAGVDRRHPLLSSYWQALSMQLFGVNSYGWRVASPLLVGLSVIPLYYFARESSSRTTALITAAAYAGSHYLMTFAKIGYNSVQAIVPLTLSLGLFALARRRQSIAGFLLLGMAVGMGFYTYAIARLVMLPVAILFLLYYPPHRKRSWYLYAVTLLGFFLVIYPVAMDRQAWLEQASKSILQSEVTDTINGRIAQVCNNILYGIIAFVANNHNSHFVFGAHLDPISGILFLVGLGVVLQRSLTSRIHLTWVLIYAVLLLTTAGLQPYSYPSNTWLWFMVPIYALFIGVGCHAVGQVVASLAGRPGYAPALSLLLVTLIIPLNFWLSVDLSQSKLGKNSLAFVLETAQSTADKDGRAPELHVIARKDFHEPLARFMFTVYEVHPVRFALHYRPADVEETVEQLCSEADLPVALLVAQSYAGRSAVQRRMEACWPEAREEALVDANRAHHFVRFITPSALSWAGGEAVAQFPAPAPPPGETPSVTLDTGQFILQAGDQGLGEAQFDEPVDIAVDDQGDVYVTDLGNKRVQKLGPDGKLLAAWNGGDEPFVEPIAVATGPGGEVWVLDSHTNWVHRFDGDGNWLGKVGGPGSGFFHARGLVVDEAGVVYVADTGGSRVVKYSEEGNRIGEIGRKGNGPGEMLGPVGLAIDEEGLLYEADVDNGRLQVLDRDGKYLTEWEIPESLTAEGHHVAVSEERVYVTDPPRHRVLVYDKRGRLLGSWGREGGGDGEFHLPMGIAVGPDGSVYVADSQNSRVQKFAPWSE